MNEQDWTMVEDLWDNEAKLTREESEFLDSLLVAKYLTSTNRATLEKVWERVCDERP